MESGEERRRFIRYRKSAFPVTIGGSSFKAYISDFSIGGLSFYIDISPITPGSTVNLKVEDLGLNIKGRVVWSKQAGSTFKAGIERFSISGHLEHFPTPDIFLGLQRSEKTGVLEIKKGPICKKIYIKNGDIIFATSNLEEDHLEEILLRTGRITFDQYYQSVNAMKKTGKHHSNVLVELGYLKPKELVWTVMYQVEEIILSLFQWENGEFEFKEGPLPAEELITLKLSVANLIYRGIKRINNLTCIKNGHLQLDAIADYSDDPLDLFQDIKMQEKDGEILFLIDGKRTVREILSLSPLDNLGTLKVLYGLLSARIIEIKEKGQEENRVCREVLKEPEIELAPAFIEKVESLYNSLYSTNHYDILGITKGATTDEVKEAYYRKTKEFHPDKHFHLPSETLKNKLNSVFLYLKEAYLTLSDKEMRSKYDQSLSPESVVKESNNSDKARARFVEGEEALRKRYYSKATELFRQAVHIDNSVADYHFYLGLALEKEKKLQDAADALNAALKLDPLNADYTAKLGHIYLELGFESRAKAAFEKAIKHDPFNLRAAEGLKKLENLSEQV